MKLLSTVAAGALLLSACAPFDHGHYAADIGYGPPAPSYAGGHGDPYYEGAVLASKRVHAPTAPVFAEPAYSVPATYSTPVEVLPPAPVVHHRAPQYVEPAPIVQASYVEPAPIVHPAPIVQASYVEPAPVVHHDYRPVAQANFPVEPVHHLPPPAPVHHAPQYVESAPYVEPPRIIEHSPGYHVAEPIQVAPIAAPVPVSKPLHYVDATPPPVVAATSVSVAEERVAEPVRYAPPEVINAPPVYMRGAPQYANQPYPEPPLPQFGAAPYGAPPAPSYGYPQPPAYGYPQPAPAFGGYGNPWGAPVAANTRPYPPGFNGGYSNPYGSGCVTTCVGSSSVF